jgi:hypothetical protein
MPQLISRLVGGGLLAVVAAVPMMTGCGDPEAGTFQAAASEKAAAEKGIKGPGQAARDNAPKSKPVRTRKGSVPRDPGGAATPKPE